jgi:hypothetical protein
VSSSPPKPPRQLPCGASVHQQSAIVGTLSLLPKFKMAPRNGRLCGKTKAPAFGTMPGRGRFNWERVKIARPLRRPYELAGTPLPL